MFITRHQRVCVIAFCGAGSAWILPGHSGMAYHELCLEIPDPGRCLPCPSQSGPSDLRAFITAIPLSKSYLIPQPPHSSPVSHPEPPPPSPCHRTHLFTPSEYKFPEGRAGAPKSQLKTEQKCFQTHSKNFRV